jgi:hypothetical protein
MYRATTNAVGFSTAGSERMRIDSSGNVGIGTTSPSSYANDNALAVVGTSNGVISVASSAGSPGIFFRDADSPATQKGYVQYDVTSNWLRLATDGAERMRIDSSGNVGIGTTPNANAKFEVVSTNAGAVTNVIQLRNGDATAGSGAKLQFLNSTVNYATAGTSEITGVRYSGNYSALTFTTYGPTSLVERMRIDGVGNVGIGTTSPDALLNLEATQNPVLRLGSSDGTVQVGDILGTIEFYSNDTNAPGVGAKIYAEQEDQNGAAEAAIVFETGVTGALVERMRINSDGLIGIGTASPQEKFHVASDDGLIAVQSSNANTADAIMGGYMIYSGDGSGPGAGNRAGIASYIMDSFGVTYDLRFYTSNSSSNLNEAMRIDSSGNLLVGTTSTPSGSVGGAALMANNQIIASRGSAAALALYRPDSNGDVALFHKGSTQVGSISVTGAATAYNTSSDYRLKENIVDAPAGNIDAIRVRSFDWKADGTHQTYGMVAQELVDVAPEAVSQGETEDDMWAVDYSKLVPMMIKEIQDLRARVAQLEGA